MAYRWYFNTVASRVWASMDAGIFHTAGHAIAADVAYVEGAVTGNQALQDVAVEGMSENISASDGVDAAMMGVGPRGGKASANRAQNVAKGIPESSLGPSGKPKVHTVDHSTRKGAKEAAERQAPSGGKVRNDASPQDGQRPHFQAENAKAENVKPVVHHCKPNKAC